MQNEKFLPTMVRKLDDAWEKSDCACGDRGLCPHCRGHEAMDHILRIARTALHDFGINIDDYVGNWTKESIDKAKDAETREGLSAKEREVYRLAERLTKNCCDLGAMDISFGVAGTKLICMVEKKDAVKFWKERLADIPPGIDYEVKYVGKITLQGDAGKNE